MARICIVAHNAVSAVFPSEGTGVGGFETRAWTMARGLAQQTPHDVTFYVRHTGRLPSGEQDGVQLACRTEPFRRIRNDVAQCVRFDSTIPTIHRFHPDLVWKLPLLLATRPFRARDPAPGDVEPELADIDCDLYAAFGVSDDASRVIATARATDRPVILFIGSNADVAAPNRADHPSGPSEETIRFVLNHAATIVVQSEDQARQLKTLWDQTSVQLPSPINVSQWMSHAADQRDYVLWIGRADEFHKRPLLCLDVARQLPDVPFLMVMNPLDPDVERRIHSEKPDNVSIRPYIPFSEMPDVFGRAAAFLSTGSNRHEGFPNVLLQAAATATPIVTMHDFDDFVERTGTGVVTGESTERLAESLQTTLMQSRTAAEQDAVIRRLAAEYDLSVFCQRLDQLIAEVLQ